MKRFLGIFLILMLGFGAFQAGNHIVSAQTYSQGNYVEPEWLPNGIQRVGREDAVSSLVTWYGNNATQGARTRWENSADEDGTIEYWQAEADGTDFKITGSAAGGTIILDGDVTITGTFSGTEGSLNLSSPPAIGDVAPNTGAFTTLSTTGAATLASAGVTGNFAVNTNKFNVTAASGNTAVAGTLGVTGATTLSSTLGVTGDVAVNTNKFTVTAASGNTAVAGTLGVTGDVAVNTNKFNVTAASGNTAIAGTLGAVGDFAVNTNKFNVTAASGNTAVAGTFSAAGAATLSSTANVVGDFSVNTNKFNVAAATGNTLVAGTLGVTGAATFTVPIADASVSDTLTASIFKGTGSTTDAVDLATAEVAGTLPAASVGNGLTDAQVSDTITVGSGGSVNTAAVPWATPGTIGSTTPNTGAFTTFSASGTSTFAGGTNGVVSSSTIPQVRLYESDQSADNRIWRWLANGAVMYLTAQDDALTTGTMGLRMTRSGTTVTGITLDATATAATGTFVSTGDISTAGNDVSLTGDATGRFTLASENALTLQGQGSVIANIDSDNDGTTASFTVQKNSATPIFTVAESGAVTATGSVGFSAANSFDFGSAAAYAANAYAKVIHAGKDDDVAGSVYIYGDGYGEAGTGGELRIYNGVDNEGYADYYSVKAAGTLDFHVGATHLASFDENGNFVPGTTETYDIGSDSLRWDRLYGDLVTTDTVLIEGVLDFVSSQVEIASDVLTPTSPEPRVQAEQGVGSDTVDQVTSVVGSSGWYILRPYTGNTITFVDDNNNLDLAGNFQANNVNDTLFIMNIGSNKFIEVSRSNNQ